MAEWEESKNRGGGGTLQGLWEKVVAATDPRVARGLMEKLAELMQSSGTIPSPTQMERLQWLASTDMVANDVDLKQTFQLVEALYRSRQVDMRSPQNQQKPTKPLTPQQPQP